MSEGVLYGEDSFELCIARDVVIYEFYCIFHITVARGLSEGVVQGKDSFARDLTSYFCRKKIQITVTRGVRRCSARGKFFRAAYRAKYGIFFLIFFTKTSITVTRFE